MNTTHGYRCFCSTERLREIANQRYQLGLPTGYDRTCIQIPQEQSKRRALEGEAHVIRLRMPGANPVFKDIVYGNVGNSLQGQSPSSLGGRYYEDPILIKSDGSPTYHFANVVDDYHMGITHVIRAAVSALPNCV